MLVRVPETYAKSAGLSTLPEMAAVIFDGSYVVLTKTTASAYEYLKESEPLGLKRATI